MERREDFLTGAHDAQGNVTLRFNSQCTKLYGPNGGHYLPCEGCLGVFEVDRNVVSFLCQACEAKVRA